MPTCTNENRKSSISSRLTPKPVSNQLYQGIRAFASWVARDPYLKKPRIRADTDGDGIPDQDIYEDEIIDAIPLEKAGARGYI